MLGHLAMGRHRRSLQAHSHVPLLLWLGVSFINCWAGPGVAIGRWAFVHLLGALLCTRGISLLSPLCWPLLSSLGEEQLSIQFPSASWLLLPLHAWAHLKEFSLGWGRLLMNRSQAENAE